MAGLIDKRKRCREDDFCCDSTPLSKRINNLHLTNNFDEAAAHISKHHYQDNHNNISNDRSGDSGVVMLSKMPLHKDERQLAMLQHYNPDLDEAENPYYYTKNRLLHELHLERLKRCAD